MVLFFTHIPFVVNHTINATPPESLQQHPLLFTTNHTDRTFFVWRLNSARPSHPGHSTILLRSEIPSGMRAELRTVAASNNRDHPTRSLYYCLFAPHTQWCYSSRTSRSWWITQSTQHHRRGCNTSIRDTWFFGPNERSLVSFKNWKLGLEKRHRSHIWAGDCSFPFLRVKLMCRDCPVWQNGFCRGMAAKRTDILGHLSLRWLMLSHRESLGLYSHITMLHNLGGSINGKQALCNHNGIKIKNFWPTYRDHTSIAGYKTFSLQLILFRHVRRMENILCASFSTRTEVANVLAGRMILVGSRILNRGPWVGHPCCRLGSFDPSGAPVTVHKAPWKITRSH